MAAFLNLHIQAMHTLLITIRSEKERAWRDKEMTYDEFCLWREGDLKKLEIAGLTSLEEPAAIPWWKFWKCSEGFWRSIRPFEGV